MTPSDWAAVLLLTALPFALILGPFIRVRRARPAHRMTRATRRHSLQLRGEPTPMTELATAPPPDTHVPDADVLDTAADLIERDHLADGMWWSGPSNYITGAKLDAFGAVAVALGIRHMSAMPTIGGDGTETLHPALAALLIHLVATSQVDLVNGAAGVDQIFAWSDEAASEEHVVATLRTVAEQLRTGAVQ